MYLEILQVCVCIVLLLFFGQNSIIHIIISIIVNVTAIDKVYTFNTSVFMNDDRTKNETPVCNFPTTSNLNDHGFNDLFP